MKKIDGIVHQFLCQVHLERVGNSRELGDLETGGTDPDPSCAATTGRLPRTKVLSLTTTLCVFSHSFYDTRGDNCYLLDTPMYHRPKASNQPECYLPRPPILSQNPNTFTKRMLVSCPGISPCLLLHPPFPSQISTHRHGRSLRVRTPDPGIDVQDLFLGQGLRKMEKLGVVRQVRPCPLKRHR